MVILKLVAAVLLWAGLYAITPTFGQAIIDALVPILLGAATIALVFWLPGGKRVPVAQPVDVNPVHLLRRGDDEGRLG